MSATGTDTRDPAVLVIACGALAKELRLVLGQLGRSPSVVYLPAPLHNRPERIPSAVRAVLDAQERPIDRVLLAYADCGTGGLLDSLMEELRVERGVCVERLPGAHCYEFFAGTRSFLEMHDRDPGTFYLTDYLARHFDALVWKGLGMDRHLELRDVYFANYSTVALVTQVVDPAVVVAGREAATRLGLRFEHHHIGLAPFESAVHQALEALS